MMLADAMIHMSMGIAVDFILERKASEGGFLYF